MQPPEDDSYKWLFTLVTTKTATWCEQMRRDFERDPKLKAWVDTKDYKQIVGPLAGRADRRPKPGLAVEGLSADELSDADRAAAGEWKLGRFAHDRVCRQGYQKPAELDAAIRQAIQLYAAKMYPRRLAWALPPMWFQIQPAFTAGAEQRDDRSGGRGRRR